MRFLFAFSIIVASLGLAACGGGNSNDRPAPPAAIGFTAFVKAQVANTSDVRDPIQINSINLIDRDQNNPDAYNSVVR
jgi:hypothetical protein